MINNKSLPLTAVAIKRLIKEERDETNTLSKLLTHIYDGNCTLNKHKHKHDSTYLYLNYIAFILITASTTN